MASVDAQIRTSHETGCAADDEHCCSAILSRHAELAEHVLRRPIPPPVWVLFEKLFHHGCDDIPRREGVDTDTILAPL